MSECPYCQNTFEMQDTCSDEFRMWQGLQGPYYIPTVDEEGVLSWTNTGGLPNPDPVDISGPAGASFSIAGIVETVADLPQSAEGVWLVGESAPYDGYSYIVDSWEFIGQFAIGPEGPQGEPGAAGASAGFGTPTATVDSSTGTPSVTVTASGPDTAKVFAFAFHNLKGAKGEDGQPGAAGQGVPTGGTTGQVLAKASGTNYDTEWVNQSGGADPATATPLMDGTGAVGSSTKYAREDHVHPSDTTRVSKSGDTMTGELNIEGAGAVVKSTNLDTTSPPSTGQTVGAGLLLKEANGVNLFSFSPRLNQWNELDINFNAHRKIGASDYYNTMALRIKGDGTNAIYLSDPAAWIKALGLGSMSAESISISDGGSGQFSTPNSSRGLLISSGSNNATKDMFLYDCSSSGSVTYVKMGSSTGLTITTATNKITIANNGGSSTTVCKISF